MTTIQSSNQQKQTPAAKRFAVMAFVCALVLGGSIARAGEDFEGRQVGIANETPKQLNDVGVDQLLGNEVDLNLPFKDEDGKAVTLKDFTKGGKPVLLSLAYYSCPGLCNFHLNGLNDAFKQMKAPLGQEFEMVVVSIEPKEGPELAARKKAAYVEAYGRPEGATGWHFLTGSEANIHKLAQEVGFKYKWDEEAKQWAHASAAYVLTPDGHLSRYFFGITFDPKVLRLSLIEASNGTIGTIVDKLVLFCFHFDPKASRYTVAAFNVMRAGGGLAVLVMAGFLIPFWWKSRKNGGSFGDADRTLPKDQGPDQGEA